MIELIIAAVVSFLAGYFLGLNARKPMNHDHQFQDHYLPGGDNE